ncbi:MAG: hypothetical protein LC803_05855 [Acidobacteria bacterium]|nr:hypothetical protein [Acidobacteriota bacterium]
MTEEERQRQMEFILDTLARLTATTDKLAYKADGLTDMIGGLAESQAAERERDQARIVRLEESFVVLADLASRHEERLDQNDRRSERLKESIAELRRLAEPNGGNG